MDLRHLSRMVAVSSVLLIAVSSTIAAPNPKDKKYSGKELDELMAKVWQNCKTDLENLRGYSFNETETFDYRDYYSWCTPCFRKHSVDYVWTLMDGRLVPIPKQFDGKQISAEAMEIKDSKERDELMEEDFNYRRTVGRCNVICDPMWTERQARLWFYHRQHPPPWIILENILDLFDEFIQGHCGSRFFPRFKYEPGRYKYAGIKQFEGHNVIEVKYNPKSGKGSTVRMLIIPEENQLVKVTLDYKSEEHYMIMDRPRDDWLPRDFMSLRKSSSGSDRHSRNFHDYEKIDVKAKFWFEDVKVKIWYDTDKPQPKQ
jgi:hypothetical protein